MLRLFIAIKFLSPVAFVDFVTGGFVSFLVFSVVLFVFLDSINGNLLLLLIPKVLYFRYFFHSLIKMIFFDYVITRCIRVINF